MNKEPLVITTYATKSYLYALTAQMPLVIAALRYAEIEHAHWVLASDTSPAAAEIFAECREALGSLVTCHHCPIAVNDNNGAQGHATGSNLVIAQLQTAAFHRARLIGAGQVWSLEADIFPQPKTLRCLMDVLAFDRGWYQVAMATYPNSAFLGGHATVGNWILPSVYPDERELTPELSAAVEEREKVIADLRRDGREATADQVAEWQRLDKEIEAAPAKGNVFALNAAKWRRRGWFESAYPGIGQGAVLPTDWVGLGCTLMTAQAVQLADWTGYEGHGTQDLFLCHRVWAPNHIRLAVTSHTLCSHAKRRGEGFELMFAHHQLGGDCHGHLRSSHQVWPPAAKVESGKKGKG